MSVVSTFLRVVVLTLAALCAGPVGAQDAAAPTVGPQSDAFWYGSEPGSVNLLYFYSPTCPHCQAAKPWLEQFASANPWLQLKRYTVKDSRENARLYFNTAKSLGVEALSTPGFVFCRQVVIGYDKAETTGKQLEEALTACHERRLANRHRRPQPRRRPARRSACLSLAPSMPRRCRCPFSPSSSPAWMPSIRARSSCCFSC
jgi:thiol-disulfide isomerase/thioredoxin